MLIESECPLEARQDIFRRSTRSVFSTYVGGRQACLRKFQPTFETGLVVGHRYVPGGAANSESIQLIISWNLELSSYMWRCKPVWKAACMYISPQSPSVDSRLTLVTQKGEREKIIVMSSVLQKLVVSGAVCQPCIGLRKVRNTRDRRQPNLRLSAKACNLPTRTLSCSHP